ncbi:MAG TPA: ATP-binding protein [Steroidobacteraceae bacterium]|nr:ATP-binding protein [Steroidobacteraceae bacterium]
MTERVEGARVLIVAPFGRDAETLRLVLEAKDYDAHICPSIDAAAELIDERVGTIVVTEDALKGSVAKLKAAMDAQPAWSMLPFILLASARGGEPGAGERPRRQLADFVSNLMVLQRPLGAVFLISAVDSAMRARQRQFEMRDRLHELAESRKALQESEAELRRAAENLERAVEDRTRQLQAEMANRIQAEAALRQSQKMEAVGQLTGGIAHDFNNMLTGIIGSLDIVKRRIASGRMDDLDRFMDAAFASAQRAAALTQRLLAFARRQSLDSRPLDVNSLVRSLEELLLRSLNERITLKFDLPQDTPAAVADENQLETAILNLVINARDAMPEGGQLTIGTGWVDSSTLEPGRDGNLNDEVGKYVVIAVADNGVGMEPQVLERVFDPFFTTKPLGQGTGLGLSMVYGFAKQSGGQVRIDSRPGKGTTVRIYLPSADRRAISSVEQDPPADVAGEGQTVLLVEDDDSVRLLITELLVELGYHPVEVRDPIAAVPILASTQAIDLMISDVGLPGMSGRQLAELARLHRPDLPILLITGYAENAAIRGAYLGANMSMITKPFDLKVLAAKISELINAPEAAGMVE